MRGFIFSLGITIIGLVLILLAVTVSNSYSIESSLLARELVFHRMQDEVEYVSRELVSITNIFNLSVSVNEKVVSVTEDMPFPNRERFEIDMGKWRDFVENRSDFNLSVDITDISNTLPLIINDEVEYKHTNGVSGNKITVEQANIVESYSVYALVKSEGSVSFDWGDISEGDQNFTLTVQTNSESSTTSKLLDFSKGNEMEITITPSEGSESEIDIGIGKGNDDGFFKFDNKNQLPITLTTNITINTTEEVWVNFPRGIINIRSDLYNIVRVTTPTVGIDLNT